MRMNQTYFLFQPVSNKEILSYRRILSCTLLTHLLNFSHILGFRTDHSSDNQGYIY